MLAEKNSPSETRLGAQTFHVTFSTLSDPDPQDMLVELEFKNYRITSNSSSFRWVACRIPLQVTLLFRNAIVSSRKYEASRKAFIVRTTSAEYQCIRQLLQGIESIRYRCFPLRPLVGTDPQRHPSRRKYRICKAIVMATR